MRRIVLLGALACGPQGDLPVSGVPDVHADVRGESDAACVLTFANAGRILVYDVAAPTVLAVASPATRAPLGTCNLDSTRVAVAVTPRANAPAISVERTGACLVAFGARMPFFEALDYDTQKCPLSATVTLACGVAALYDAAPLALCSVGM